MELTGIDTFEDAATVWLRHVCLGSYLVGLVDARVGDGIRVTLYDTSVKEVDIVINNELTKLGLAK